jgi:site-specific DNA recombinase
MSVAIYARYSSENQRPQSIQDQLRNCFNYANKRNLTVAPEHIYTDEAISGALVTRPGLDKLTKAVEEGHVKKVLVDDLSRLFRDNTAFANLMAQFKYSGVEVISVSDGISSLDDSATLNFGMRGVINEMYLEDLARKTHRGQAGQASKGSFMGSPPYGYRRPIPVGDSWIDSKGRTRADKFKLPVDPEEAEVVREIFKLFVEGKSANAIANHLNQKGVSTRNNLKGGWSNGTIAGILQNEKYVGKLIWNKTKSVKNPKTGRKVAVARPVEEWIVNEDPDIRIIDDGTWNVAQQRWKEINAAFPKGKKGFGSKQKGKAASHPSALLCGSLQCSKCGGQIGMVSGKGGGYYGCMNARRGSCDNTVKVRRKVIEQRFIEILQQRVLQPEHFELLCKEIENAIKEEAKGIPEDIRLKTDALEDYETKLNRLLEFIEEGRATSIVAKRVEDYEAKIATLRSELSKLREAEANLYTAPPREWIVYKVDELGKTLETKTEAAALAIRRYFGPITLMPKVPEVGRPYFEAKCRVKVLPIMEQGRRTSNEGATTQEWWRWGESNPRPRSREKSSLHV